MTQSGPEPVQIIQGDITAIPADAIVNAANSELAMGGGVCGAIFREAGVQALTGACDEIGHCPTGSAVITPAFAIKTAKFIIHAVGPAYARYAPDEARELLRAAYRSAILLAAENSCRSIAIPALSTGIYGYPLDEACAEAIDVCLTETEATGVQVKLVGFDDKTVNCLERHLDAAR